MKKRESVVEGAALDVGSVGRMELTMPAVCFTDAINAAEQQREAERRPPPPSLTGKNA